MPTEIKVAAGTDADGRPYFVPGLLPGSGEFGGRGYFTPGEGGSGREVDGRPYLAVPQVLRIKVPTPFEEILGSGSYRLEHRLYRSNLAGEELEEIRTMRGGSVTMSNFRDHAWELFVPLEGREKDGLFGEKIEVWVKAMVEVADPDGPEDWQRFPLGLYLARCEKGKRGRTHSEWELRGSSPEVLLEEDDFPLGYLADAGTNVLEEARRIILGMGVSPERIVFPPAAEDVALTTPYRADAIQNASSTKKIRVVNGLLNAGGFFAVYADAEGRYRTKKIEDRPDRAPDVRYDRRHLAGPVDTERQIDERHGNRIVVQVTDPNDQFIVFAENHDPESPMSREQLGRFVTPDPVVLQNATSREEAERLARELVRRAAALGEKLSFPALADPRRGPKETYELDWVNDQGEVVASGPYYPVGYTAPRELGPWTHEVGRSARVEPAVQEVS